MRVNGGLTKVNMPGMCIQKVTTWPWSMCDVWWDRVVNSCCI